ncbi:hypothetical protein AQUCO_02800045v1 [Aquilegia coerulea]|uniref:Uncharacterized protein n=1 Tax=Aquilegia coerulea TaxID=218851 RepID=A0A2G5D3M9_AQUCA|nr:hypothetical protein AQUCO_02800045v1 [Aquilegia coerulea]
MEIGMGMVARKGWLSQNHTPLKKRSKGSRFSQFIHQDMRYNFHVNHACRLSIELVQISVYIVDLLAIIIKVVGTIIIKLA